MAKRITGILLALWIGTGLVPFAASTPFEVSIRDRGAVGDGVTDDTAAIQSAVDEAVRLGGGVVLFAPGVYLVSSIDIQDGLILSGYGATLRKISEAGKWSRTFTTQNRPYSGDSDSRPLVIKGFRFDGNRTKQGEYEKYQLEQQHMIFLRGNPENSGRLVATIEDCTFRDGVADAISVYTNVSAKISNCAAYDVFRGGVVVTGGHSEVQVMNFTAGGEIHETGIDVEVDGAGYDGSYRVEMTVDGLILDGDFDVAIKDDSIFLGSNIVSPSGPFNLLARDSTIRLSNSVFGVGLFSSYGNRVVFPNDVTFSDCTFIANEPGEATGDNRIAALHVFWNISGTYYRDQNLRLIDCDFQVSGAVETEDKTQAIFVQADKTSLNNRLLLRGGNIAEEFDEGVYLRQGGRALIQDTRIEAATGVHFGAAKDYPIDVEMDGVRFGEETDVAESLSANHPGNVLTHNNILLEENQNNLRAAFGLAKNTYRGGRTILGTKAPDKTPGLLGDRYRLRKPVPGEDYEWICTESDHEDATWKRILKISN